LNGGRFKVEVGWRVPSQGTSGSGRAVTLTGDTGQFWFFSANNIELVIKVVDGRGFNGKFWVFYGALSDVEYTIQVTDTATGNSKTFVNPSGHLASVADTSGFDTVATPTPTPTPTVPAATATPVPTPTRTPTPGSSLRVVNVGQGGANSFIDAVSGNSSTTIHVGDTVKWVFPSQNFHSATSGRCTGVGGYYDDGGCTPDGEFDSNQLYAGQSYSHTFTAAGSYGYYCSVHGSMMTGTVLVNP
jgi:plastocyanin